MAAISRGLAAAIPAGVLLAASIVLTGSQAPSPIDRGRALYAARCVGCHGATLQGQPNWKTVDKHGHLPAPPLDGTGHAWMHSDEELAHIIKFSLFDIGGPGYETDMPAFGKDFGDRDIADLVAFIRSRWPTGAQAAQSFLNPGRAGMPAHVDPDWRLPPDCEEPVRRAPPPIAKP